MYKTNALVHIEHLYGYLNDLLQFVPVADNPVAAKRFAAMNGKCEIFKQNVKSGALEKVAVKYKNKWQDVDRRYDRKYDKGLR